MIGASGAREGAAGHATVPLIGQKGDRLLRTTTNRDTKGNHTDKLKGFGRVKSSPSCYFIARNSHTSRQTGRRIILFLLPRVEVGLLSEQRREASRSFSYNVWFHQRVQPSKWDDYTSTRQTSQQEEAQEWRRSTFWLCWWQGGSC